MPVFKAMIPKNNTNEIMPIHGPVNASGGIFMEISEAKRKEARRGPGQG
jgi:hypothetical protein